MPPLTQDENPSFGQALPLGFEIGCYQIEDVLGRGGFGITYLALDTRLKRKVVIKENFPQQFSFRDTESAKVLPLDPREEDSHQFHRAMEKFLEEARVMAALEHPGIVKVLEFFEANGTAYFVMPHVEGRSFAQVIKSRISTAQHFSEDEILALLTGILHALKYLHGRQVFHRDIKPDNILITESFDPILIDLGGFATAGSDESITVIESAGYTPLEQLERKGNIGAWTDLYALGSTFCFAVTGEKLPDSVKRIRDDPWKPLSGRFQLYSNYSYELLESIDKAVEVDETKRLRSADEWLALIDDKEGLLDSLVDPDDTFLNELIEDQIPDGTEHQERGFDSGEKQLRLGNLPLHQCRLPTLRSRCLRRIGTSHGRCDQRRQSRWEKSRLHERIRLEVVRQQTQVI